jgi:hypothetical protein
MTFMGIKPKIYEANGSGYFDGICNENFYANPEHLELKIGYSNSLVPFLLLPSLALLLNIFIIATHIRKSLKLK